MSRYQSIRVRITLTFSLVGFLLGAVFGGLVYGLLHDLEDTLSIKRLTLEADHFFRKWQDQPMETYPDSALIWGFQNNQGIPEHLNAIIHLTPGIHELGEDFLVIIKEDAQGTHRFCLVQDNRSIEPLEDLQIKQAILFIVLLITTLSGGMGALLGRRMLAPLHRLAKEVSALDPKALPNKLSGTYYEDEVGQVAKAVSLALNQVDALIKREQRFTRNASHELRTPVTVLKGATEVIERCEASGKSIQRPLKRAKRSIHDMENIIQTFLVLSREGHLMEASEPVCLNDLISNLIEEHKILIEHKKIEVIQDPCENATFHAPPILLRIAVGNLIRNAFQHTRQGSVRVTGEMNRVTVTDTGPGIPGNLALETMTRAIPSSHPEGFGLGLAIVNDFCVRLGWRLMIEKPSKEGTTIIIEGNTPENRRPAQED
jgi:signal transduction histidine kinase